ncbi:MAG: heme exporter protein CcmD [Psychromonas sp.]|nr:heme exporter protein CcmD [Psychromonas sp.]
MAFHSLVGFLHMGGYAFYVWLAYGIAMLSIVILVVNTLMETHKIKRFVKKRMLRDKRIQKAQKMEGAL